MNAIMKQMLQGIIKILIGGDRWVKVKDAVLRVKDANLTGPEKRAVVINELKIAGWDIAKSLMNLAIEIAVVVLAKTAADLAKK